MKIFVTSYSQSDKVIRALGRHGIKPHHEVRADIRNLFAEPSDDKEEVAEIRFCNFVGNENIHLREKIKEHEGLEEVTDIKVRVSGLNLEESFALCHNFTLKNVLIYPIVKRSRFLRRPKEIIVNIRFDEHSDVRRFERPKSTSYGGDGKAGDLLPEIIVVMEEEPYAVVIE